MRTALDSSVILDVVMDDPEHGERSERAIRQAAEEGALLISNYVLAEILPAWPEPVGEQARAFLAEWNIELVEGDSESHLDAGLRLHRLHRLRSEPLAALLPTVLIGCHALHHADRLLTRNASRWQEMIEELEVVEP